MRKLKFMPPERPSEVWLKVGKPSVLSWSNWKRPATHGSKENPGVGRFRAIPNPIGTVNLLVLSVPVPLVRSAERIPTPAWTLMGGASYGSSPVSKSDRNPSLPFDAQIRLGTGVRYQWREHTTFGLSYEYLDLGDGELTQRLPGGTLSGDYSRNYVQFLAFTIARSF